MHVRSILSLAAAVSLTWASAFLFAMACAGFAIVAFFSDEVPSTDDVAVYAIVGMTAFSFPLSLFMTMSVWTCGTTREDILWFWMASMILTASMAPAVGAAILDAPNAAALLNGCIVALVIMAVFVMVVPLLGGLCARFGLCDRCMARDLRHDSQRDSQHNSYTTEMSPNVSSISSIEPPTVPYVVIDHPNGDLHVGCPDTYQSFSKDGSSHLHPTAR